MTVHDSNERAAETAESSNRRHFLVDINKLFRFFGKRYFIIFYFGRHLHPRQKQLVNQKTRGNAIAFALVVLFLGGFAFAIVELTAYRLSQNTLACVETPIHFSEGHILTERRGTTDGHEI